MLRRVFLVALLALVLLGGAARADSPQVISVGGSLVGGGDLSGTAEIDFVLNSSSTYTGTITVDGSALASASVSQGSGHLFLDTTKLVDGGHAVVVSVSDGTSTTTVWSGSIETLNAPQGGVPTVSGTPAVGATLSAAPGRWSPTPTAIAYQWELCTPAGACNPIAGAADASFQPGSADANAELEVQVLASNANGTTIATSAPTAPIAATLGAGSDTGGQCADPQLHADLDGQATETVALGVGATLQGELDCGGSGVAGASLELTISAPSDVAAPSYASVQTAADGSFSYALAAGTSRAVTVSYGASAAGTQPTVVARVALLVRPRITLQISPRATTNHHTITFTGRVLGGHIARGGLPLQLEYREGSRWMIYTEVLARASDGRYRYRYTFERTTQAITYTFRVAIPSTGVAGYPYQPVASRSCSVHVDP